LASGKLLNFENFLMLSADTVVILDSEIIGKPLDLEDAAKKLGRLSGRSHLVKTALCLSEVASPASAPVKTVTAVETSEVFFKTLSTEEIREYVRRHRPLDKAGAYGVQDMPPGYITRVEGNLDNVMGLPVKLVEEILEKNGWQVRRRKS
jgi:septum formation protein